MEMIIYVLYGFVGLLALLAVVAELRRTTMMMQQNSYRISRYMGWLRKSGDTTSYVRLVGMCAFFAALSTLSTQLWGLILIGVFCAGLYFSLIRMKYKKPLVVTARVKRIFACMIALCVIIIGGFVLAVGGAPVHTRIYAGVLALVALYLVSHIVTIGAVWLLLPVERHINRGYYRDAQRIISSMPSLKVVGITGSYGKTSTKHFLHALLSEQYETLMTPGSYNTTMGVIRTIREMMKPYTEVFICEMGAKQPGDIKEICDLVHPQIGILTAVGPQHLESFKTIERVGETKFELIDSLPADGLAVVNVDFPYIAGREITNVPSVSYGVDNPAIARYRAESLQYNAKGSTFTLVDAADGSKSTYTTTLLGRCNVSNLVACVIVARHLGVPDDKIRRAMAQIEAVEHRLSVKRTPGGVTILDDAFNSNPSGSAMALEVLGQMSDGRRIVVTPGMIELGEQQYELNRELGENVARNADIAFVVGQYNRDAILEGIASVNDHKVNVITVESFAESQTRLAPMLRSGDVVLYENDLPDTFK